MTAGYRRLLPEYLTTHVVTMLICGFYHYGQTENVFDLRLADGPSPNMGRVEMYLGNKGWFTTCDPSWDINDAIVVCKQLGFPGAAFAKADSTYRAKGVPLARTVRCTGYEARLQDCPYHTTGLCTSAVGVVCQEPSYVGCYADEPTNSMFRAGHDLSRVMGLSECKAFCKTKKARYIGLKNTQECYCGRTGRALSTHEKLKDTECQMPCAGHPDEICGGVSTKGHYVISVHELGVGECEPLTAPTNGVILDTEFSYGKVVRFQCDSGFVLAGSETIRCVINRGGGPKEVAWNPPAPVCVVLADNPGLVLAIALVVVLAMFAPAFIFVILRRHYARRKMLLDAAKADKHSYQDLMYNPSYELNSASYEPLRPPRKRDALRQQKTKTAPSALHLDPYTNMDRQYECGLEQQPVTSSSMRNLATTSEDVRPLSARNDDLPSFHNEDSRSSQIYSNDGTLRSRSEDWQNYTNEGTLNFKNSMNKRRLHNSSTVRSKLPLNKLINENRDNLQTEDESHYAVAI